MYNTFFKVRIGFCFNESPRGDGVVESWSPNNRNFRELNLCSKFVLRRTNNPMKCHNYYYSVFQIYNFNSFLSKYYLMRVHRMPKPVLDAIASACRHFVQYITGSFLSSSLVFIVFVLETVSVLLSFINRSPTQ